MAFDDRKATEIAVQAINDIAAAMPSPAIIPLIKKKAPDKFNQILAAEQKADRARTKADMPGLKAAIEEYKRLWLGAINQFTAA